MKITRLPEIDLARIAPLKTAEKQSALEAFKSGQPPRLTYKPLRSCFGEILNTSSDLFPETKMTPWSQIERFICSQATTLNCQKANLSVAKGLHSFLSNREVRSRKVDFKPLYLNLGIKVEYWLPYALLIDGSPYVVFVDPRRNKSLNEAARLFAFSMMNEHIRLANPDYSTFKLGIFQFSKRDLNSKEKERPARFIVCDEVGLLNSNDLEQMVTETYDIWLEISEARTSLNKLEIGPLFATN
jgi:hypothetical protein